MDSYDIQEEVVSRNEKKEDKLSHDPHTLPVKHTTADYSFLPIRRPSLKAFYDKQKKVFWTPEELNFLDDRNDWKNSLECTPPVKKLVIGILSFFVPADGLVNKNIIDNFKKDTSSLYKEAGFFYSIQEAMENIHSETYSLSAENIIDDAVTINEIFNSMENSPSIQKISDFMFKYMDREYSLPERVVAFACVEGILFNSAFACIYWIKKKGILKGFCKANEFIARDEAIHTEFAVELFHEICKEPEFIRPSKESINAIITEAVDINEIFIKSILPADLIGMSVRDLTGYTKFIADELLVMLGYTRLYGNSNPFDWMSIIGLSNKSNFFETTVTEYGKISVKCDFENKNVYW